MRKLVGALIALLLVLSSITLVKPLLSAPTPAIPEFYVRLAAHPYDVPDAYGADDTGKTVLRPGYHVDNQSLEVLVKNQPFAPSLNGVTYHLYYNVRIKGPCDQDWIEQYHYSQYSPGNCPLQSSSEYTTLSFPQVYPDGATVDFQVKALVGTDDQQYTVMNITSAWSNTQTITIDTSSPTIIPTTPP